MIKIMIQKKLMMMTKPEKQSKTTILSDGKKYVVIMFNGILKNALLKSQLDKKGMRCQGARPLHLYKILSDSVFKTVSLLSRRLWEAQ